MDGGLILMRRAGESVEIGDNIVVTVVSLDRNRVRLHFSAPRNIRVDRSEVRRKIERELARVT